MVSMARASLTGIMGPARPPVFERYDDTMTLLNDYNESVEPQFAAKLIMALSIKAKIELTTLVGTDPEYYMSITMIRHVLSADTSSVKQFTRIFAANGVNNDDTDVAIQAAVDANWDYLIKVFDPEV